MANKGYVSIAGRWRPAWLTIAGVGCRSRGGERNGSRCQIATLAGSPRPPPVWCSTAKYRYLHSADDTCKRIQAVADGVPLSARHRRLRLRSAQLHHGGWRSDLANFSFAGIARCPGGPAVREGGDPAARSGDDAHLEQRVVDNLITVGWTASSSSPPAARLHLAMLHLHDRLRWRARHRSVVVAPYGDLGRLQAAAGWCRIWPGLRGDLLRRSAGSLPSRHRLAGYSSRIAGPGWRPLRPGPLHVQPSSGYQLMSELVDELRGTAEGLCRLFTCWRVPLQQTGTMETGMRLCCLRRSRSARLHPHAHRSVAQDCGPGPETAFEDDTATHRGQSPSPDRPGH